MYTYVKYFCDLEEVARTEFPNTPIASLISVEDLDEVESFLETADPNFTYLFNASGDYYVGVSYL